MHIDAFNVKKKSLEVVTNIFSIFPVEDIEAYREVKEIS